MSLLAKVNNSGDRCLESADASVNPSNRFPRIEAQAWQKTETRAVN
jgi:hypothetical protein